MIKLITLVAFINASVFTAPAMAADPIHQQFQTGVQKMQAQMQFENYKKTVDVQKQGLEEKQKALYRGIQDDAVILRARLNELDYLSDFLKVDNSAKEAVEASLEAARGPNHTKETVLTASVVALISGGVYALGSSSVPNAEKDTPALKRAKTILKNNSNVVTRTLENARGNTLVKNVSGVVFVVSILTAASALASNYYSTAPQKEAAVNQQRIYLSRLASDGQNDYLTKAQVDQNLSQRTKDTAFGAKVTAELDSILRDTSARTAAINQKHADIAQLSNQMNVLDDQVAAQHSLLQQQANVAH